jgi:hypothetical protein
VSDYPYPEWVDSYDDFRTLKKTIAANVDALMRHHWGHVNKSKLARAAAERDPLTGNVLAKAGQGTYDRLQDEDRDVGISVLRRVAGAFGMQAWMLMVPDLDPAKPPNCVAMTPLAADCARSLDQIEDEDLRRKLHAMIDQLARRNHPDELVAPSLPPKAEPHRQR